MCHLEDELKDAPTSLALEKSFTRKSDDRKKIECFALSSLSFFEGISALASPLPALQSRRERRRESDFFPEQLPHFSSA